MRFTAIITTLAITAIAVPTVNTASLEQTGTSLGMQLPPRHRICCIYLDNNCNREPPS